MSRVLGCRQKQLIEIIRGVIRQNVARSKVSGNNQDCVDTHGWLDPCPSLPRMGPSFDRSADPSPTKCRMRCPGGWVREWSRLPRI